MALTKAEIELMALITDEKDRDILGPLFEKHPVLRQGFEGHLRQEDYNRQMNQWRVDKEKVETERVAAIARADAAVKNAKEWNDYHEKEKPVYEKATADNKRLTAEKATLESEIAKLTEGRGIDMDENELRATLDTRFKQFEDRHGQAPNQDQIKAIVGQEVKNMVDARAKELQTEFMTKTFPATTQFQADLLDAKLDYHDEFGVRMDTQAFLKFMAEKQINDPSLGYKEFVSEKRETAKLAKFETEKKQAVDAAVAEALKGRGLPTGDMLNGKASLDNTGALQMRELHPEVFTKPDDVRIGPGYQAQRAAAELVAEGKI